MRQWLLFLALGLAAGSAQAAPPSPSPCAVRLDVHEDGERFGEGGFAELVKALQEAYQAQPGIRKTLNHLLLSGGGSRGAWGAGVLDGWTDASGGNGGPRPHFDMVTGVSTGAVQATPAFLGDSEDDRLVYGYENTKNRHVYGFPHPIIPFPRNLNKLRKTLSGEDYLPDDLIKRVPDRRGVLAVGTLDIESGLFWSWDMKCLARKARDSGKKKDFDLYREVILASAANPAGIRPIKLGDKKHVDGGVRYRLFAERMLVAAALAADLVNADTQRVYYIVNGKPDAGRECVSNFWFPGIMRRGLDIALKEGIFGSLYAAHYHMHETGGKPWKFLGSWIDKKKLPDDLDLPKSGEYEVAKMRELVKHGRAWGLANQWHQGFPPADRRGMTCTPP